MRKLILALAAAGAVLTVATPAMAREGCGRGWHRADNGRCYRNNVRRVVVAPRGGRVWVTGRYYQGRGYWNGRGWYQHRRAHRGGWRYY